MLSKQKVYTLLQSKQIPYQNFDHAPIFTVAEGDALGAAFHQNSTRNLFLRDKKKHNYYLVTLPCHKDLDLEVLRQNISSKRLSFASPEDLWDKLGSKPGAVNPLCILNDTAKAVTMVFDASLAGQKIGLHPMSNDATILVQFEDILHLIKDAGHPVVLCKM